MTLLLTYAACNSQAALGQRELPDSDVASFMRNADNAPWRRAPTPSRSTWASELTTTRRVLQDPRPDRVAATRGADDPTLVTDEAGHEGHRDRSRSPATNRRGDGADPSNATEPSASSSLPPRPICRDPERPAAAQATPSQPDPLNLGPNHQKKPPSMMMMMMMMMMMLMSMMMTMMMMMMILMMVMMMSVMMSMMMIMMTSMMMIRMMMMMMMMMMMIMMMSMIMIMMMMFMMSMIMIMKMVQPGSEGRSRTQGENAGGASDF